MADSDDNDHVVRKLPAPKADLHVNFTTWAAGKPIYRIHSAEFTAVQFNPGKGGARFLKSNTVMEVKEVSADQLSVALIEPQASQKPDAIL
ncbi:hypothetical protein [Yersinia aleksiciae]|uniref:hypothetical protein n=1 Tax=Yersinia aleksiciae TaxID=263819 RepID=UPI0021BDDB3F|nr:hypothetical protein [Yersinia aleksiciae]